MRFNSNRTSLVESLSGDDSDSKTKSITGQNPLVNLINTGSIYSPKGVHDPINMTNNSKNPFDDEDTYNND